MLRCLVRHPVQNIVLIYQKKKILYISINIIYIVKLTFIRMYIEFGAKYFKVPIALLNFNGKNCETHT